MINYDDESHKKMKFIRKLLKLVNLKERIENKIKIVKLIVSR